ncbi:MAG: sigma 54-interacting transcriptional regulator, partial [Myxococcales bacterium]
MEPALCESPRDHGRKLCRFCSVMESVGGARPCQPVAGSGIMRELTTRAASISHTDSAVIIVGESGTGKEVLARAIHANSPRRKAPFLAVNVAALPAELLESEL